MAREAVIDVEPDAGVLEVPLDQIKANPEQPRRVFADDDLDALADSIRSHGVLQPVVVQPLDDGYQLIAGERRVRAAQRAGLVTLPAIVRHADGSPSEALELALVENLLREDLNPIEEASAYARLSEGFGMSHEAIALRLGRTRPAVTNSIRLLALPPEVQSEVASGRLTPGHARALLALTSAAEQVQLAVRIIDQGLTVRDVERLLRGHPSQPGHSGPRTPRGRSPQDEPASSGAVTGADRTADDRALQRGFEAALGLPVELRRRRDGSGQLLIGFASDEDLDSLYQRLGGSPL